LKIPRPFDVRSKHSSETRKGDGPWECGPANASGHGSARSGRRRRCGSRTPCSLRKTIVMGDAACEDGRTSHVCGVAAETPRFRSAAEASFLREGKLPSTLDRGGAGRGFLVRKNGRR